MASATIATMRLGKLSAHNRVLLGADPGSLPAERLDSIIVVILRILSYLAADDLIRSFGKLLPRASHRWSQHRLAWLRILVPRNAV